MKKFFLIPVLGIATAAFGQYYPQNGYPQNGYPQQNYPQANYPQQNYPQNNSGWGDEDNGYGNNSYGTDPYAYGNFDYSSASFPDDYYYNYPTDYYPQGYYQGYYNDYRNSIVNVNWPGFYAQFNLSPFQIRQITILNNRFSSYGSWYGYYGMNPDRWYYDRYYALQQILGPQVFVVFQNRYFHGYTPWAYYQNYRRTYYIPRYQVMPQYRNVNIITYRIDRDRFFENRGFVHGGAVRSFPGGGFARSQRHDGFRNTADMRGNARRFENRENIGETRSLQNGGFHGTPNRIPQDGGNIRQNGGFRENALNNSSGGGFRGMPQMRQPEQRSGSRSFEMRGNSGGRGFGGQRFTRG